MAAHRAERFARGADKGEVGDEYYSEIPIREPVLQTLAIEGETVGLVTRNRYGCRVLNTDRVLFADIDLTPPRQAAPGLISKITRWFRPTPLPTRPDQSVESSAIEHIERWHAQTGIAVRVYRTFAGLRVMVVDRQFAPLSPEAADILLTLKSDPLYVQLTKRQDCFRARLSPKPWRIGVSTPSHRSEIARPSYADELARWAEPYEVRAAKFATCRLIQTFGEPAADDVIRAIIALHDSESLNAESSLA